MFFHQQPPNEEHPFLLPEFELVIEAEDIKSTSDGEESEVAAEQRRQAEAARLEAEQTGDLASLPEADFMQFAGTNKDPVFSKFQKRVERHKDQVSTHYTLHILNINYNFLRFYGMTVAVTHFGYPIVIL